MQGVSGGYGGATARCDLVALAVPKGTEAIRFDPALSLEMLNGVGLTLAICFVAFLKVYLAREHKSRNLRFRDWFFRLPPSMHLVAAIYVFDLGFVVRAGVIWIWRRFFDGGDNLHPARLLLFAGSVCSETQAFVAKA
jgi:hypothetical protein